VNLSDTDVLSDQFFEVASNYPKNPCLYEKSNGIWHGLTYAEAAHQVLLAANFLKSQGVNKGDRVVIASENRIDWAIADLAIMTLGALVVPSYSTNTSEDHHHVLTDSGAVLAITSSGELSESLAAAAERSLACQTLVLFDRYDIQTQKKRLKLVNWHDGLAAAKDIAEIEDVRAKLDPNDLACLIYTSGTGGLPKGVMLSHGSISANVKGVKHMLSEVNLDYQQRFLSLLPLSHSYEHTGGLHLPIRMASEIWYCESVDQVSTNLQEAKPTLMIAVPRLYEVLHDRIENGLKAKGGLSEKLFRKAVALGLKKLEGEKLSFSEAIWDRVLERLVRAKVRRRLGGRLQYFCSGGAPLNPEIGKFFLAIGVGILQGYGQTEASPVISLNPPKDIRISSVGKAVPGVELKIDPEGEILVRGDLMMQGYWNNPAATGEAIRDGWLHTGDLGHLSDDGFLSITGRKKEIIVNSGGDNIAPARIEAMLTMQGNIDQAMISGDKRPWLAAVVVPSQEVRKLPRPEQEKFIKVALEKVNENLSMLEKVRRFVLADEPFSIENSEMTPTLKIRRHIVLARYQDELDKLYSR